VSSGSQECNFNWLKCAITNKSSILYITSYNKMILICDNQDEEGRYEGEILLLFIERVSDSFMSGIRSDRKLNEEEVKLLVDSYDYKKYDNNYNPEIVESLGLEFRDDNEEFNKKKKYYEYQCRSKFI